MSGDPVRIVLGDPGGVMAPVLEGLSTVLGQLGSVEHCLVGGLAVFARVGAHRATFDVDTALRADEAHARELLLAVGGAVPGERRSFELENGVVVDTLLASPSHRPPRPGTGRPRLRQLAAGFAVDTAEELTLELAPPASCGAVEVRTATVPALIALKVLACDAVDRRLDKRRSDLLDLWRLLVTDLPAAPSQLRTLRDMAPEDLGEQIGTRLLGVFDVAGIMLTELRGVAGAPQTRDELVSIREALLEPLFG